MRRDDSTFSTWKSAGTRGSGGACEVPEQKLRKKREVETAKMIPR